MRAIVLDDVIVDIPAAMAFWGEVIVTETDVVTVLTQPFHLIVNLLGDATMLRKTMIDKKQYFHNY